MANYHVSGNRRDGYSVKREHAARAADHVDVKAQAYAIARTLVKNSGGGEVRIHRPDGPIGNSNTIPPARDPFPPRDTKH